MMIGLGEKVARGLLCLMAAFVGAARAAPSGPLVYTGSASYDPATLTVASTTPRTQIGWQSFGVAAGEVVTFIQPGAQSAVLNQVFDAHSLNILGRLRSNGSVYFIANGRLSGAGVDLDLAGVISTSLRLPRVEPAPGRVAPAHPLTTLEGGSIYVIGEDDQAVAAVNGDVVLNPGRTVALAYAAMPHLQVGLTAPEAEAINLSRLVAGRRATGIFAGLFHVPAAARHAVGREADRVLTASAQERAPDAPAMERFFRHALLYARMRSQSGQPEGGMMQVAAASSSRMLLPAARSRPSLLPREIEIGAQTQRARDAVAETAFSPAPAALQTPPVPVARERESEPDNAQWLALAPAAPPAEMVATLLPQPRAPQREPERDTELVLALPPAAPPAEMVATLLPQPRAPQHEPERDTGLVLALAPAAPPAEMVATLLPQPRAPQHEPERDTELVLALAPAAPPAEMVATLLPPVESRGAGAGGERKPPAAAVIVVALAGHAATPAPQEEAKAKEIRIERRAPRYFTDYRGALFFM